MRNVLTLTKKNMCTGGVHDDEMCMFIFVLVYRYIYMYIHIYIYIYIYICMCIYINVYTNKHTYTVIYVWMYTDMYMHMNMYTHIYIYIYIFIHIYIYIFIDTQNSFNVCLWHWTRHFAGNDERCEKETEIWYIQCVRLDSIWDTTHSMCGKLFLFLTRKLLISHTERDILQAAEKNGEARIVNHSSGSCTCTYVYTHIHI